MPKVNTNQVVELGFKPRKTGCRVHVLNSTLDWPIDSEHKLLHLEGIVDSLAE